ncbi:hypothetical protein B0H15DRAFT_911550 [Mycena belliarum]|uniref:Uncharacterized protein n=1 Tax=Mycena belliarum TaxID=1033014 RepID=A0AAD6U094_9AGAR|nr:hypothetical protein B0H15DRAFT_911550 [Mycena belliae]
MIFTGSKSVLACASIFLALAAQTSAHAIPTVPLGVKGAPKRNDVQRPSNGKPCGNVNPANTLDSSTAVPANADGTVNISVVNFNAGGDGSTSVSVQVDATGTGNKFVAGTVKTNGNPKPNKVQTDKVVFALPAGTKCSGGKGKNLCLVSVKTTSGFGACVVVSQGKAAALAPAAAAPAKTNNTPAKANNPPAKANNTPAKAKNTPAKPKTTAAKSNQGATTKAGAAKKQSKANGKGKGKGKGKKNGKGKGKKNGKGKGKGKATKNGDKKQATKQAKAPAAVKTVKGRDAPSRIFLREIIAELEAQRRAYGMELEALD